MMMNVRIARTPLALASLFCAAWTYAAAAAPRLALAPAVIPVTTKFGQTVRESVTLDNQTPTGIPFSMSAEDVLVRNGKRTFVQAGQTPGSIAATAVFSQRSGYIAARSQQTVEVLLTVPVTTKVRGVVVFFRSNRVLTQSGVMLNASLGALVTFTLTGDVHLDAETPRITPATESENLRISDLLVNTGREPLVAAGVAAILSARGALIARIPFSSTRFMPGERLRLAAEYAGTLRPGRYRAICTFTYSENDSITRTVSFPSH